jgi:hypothetical protein
MRTPRALADGRLDEIEPRRAGRREVQMEARVPQQPAVDGWRFVRGTKARSGGCKYNPTMSRTLSMNNGSFEILNVSRRYGCSANAFHIRATVD